MQAAGTDLDGETPSDCEERTPASRAGGASESALEPNDETMLPDRR